MSSSRLRCDLCKNSQLDNLYKNVEDYETFIDIKTNIIICKKCKLIQQSKLFTKNEIENFYLEDYHGRNYGKKSLLATISLFLRERYYFRFINLLESQTNDKNIKILDYGSGDGFLCNLLYKRGYKNVYTCDFFKPNFINLKNHIFPQDIVNYHKFFDIMFMINSIEHLISFSKDFSRLDSSMKNNSTLIIETPNFGSLDSIIFKKYWGGLHQPRHTFLWTKTSLIKHLSLWNYKSRNIKTPQPAHWAISIQNILSHKFKPFKVFLRNGRMPGYLIIVLFFLPISFIQNIFGLESVTNLISTRNTR